MKRVFPLLASAHLALGQATVVTCLTEDQPLNEGHDSVFGSIGIIPVEDYEKATAEIKRLQKELAAFKEKETNMRKIGAVVAQQKKMVESLRQQLTPSGEGDVSQREKALIEKINKMESERANATKGFKKRVGNLKEGSGEKESAWDLKIGIVEEERNAEIKKRETAELKFLQTEEQWRNAVLIWQEEAQKAFRTALLAEVQESVAITARLASDWQTERKSLENKVVELEQRRTYENQAWQASVTDWQKKVENAMRITRVQDAQEAVANTAHLASAWQVERDALEEQVKSISGKLANLEGQLGVQGFEDKQAEVLRLGLMKKSQALSNFGDDAAKLAEEWKNEQEQSRRDLDAMRNLYKSTTGEVKEKDERIVQLDSALTEKNKALELLANEANKLSENWKNERGGLQKKIAEIERQLLLCQGKLEEEVAKEKRAQAQVKKLGTEKKGLTSKVKEDGIVSARLIAQLAAAAELRQQFTLAKKSEGKLKNDLSQLRNEVVGLKTTMGEYKSQKAADAEAIAALQAELKQVKKDYEVVARDLATATKSLQQSEREASELRLMSKELSVQLSKAGEDLKVAQQQAVADQNVKAEAAAKALQVKNLEGQLGRLAVAQQELEAALTGTLGDFEKLQQSYLELQAESADGGEVAKEAIAARKVAEVALQSLQGKLRGEESKLEAAQKRVQEVELKKKEVEEQAKGSAQSGKEALAKCEAELQKARREMSQLQQGQKILVKETEELRQRFVHIEPVRYELASANVVAQQQRVLAEVKQVLEVYPKARFEIKGHTCNLGEEEGNLELSKDRAEVLREFLIKNGINTERFSLVEGLGQTEPEASNDTDQGRRQNRRVEIEVVR